MRKYFLLFSLVALSANARERSLSSLQRAAASFLSVAEASSQSSESEPSVALRKEHLTVLDNGTQFVVMANDDAFTTVVGYSDAPFSAKNEGLMWFLEAVNQSMMQQGEARQSLVVPDASKYQAKIDPLLATTWNQDAPFNDLCPKAANGGDYPSGCVATALSQIMKFHAYPAQGRGEKQYSFKPAAGVGQILYANFGETTYQWDKMLNNYKSGSYTEEEGNAVATLMMHCGVAVEMNYTSTGSGAYSSEARNGLVTYFGYHENMGIVYRSYYSLEQWMDMLYAELNQNRPIYYSGSDARQGGHAFVIDGYDENGLVHVNWGWGADGGNGFFDITLLNPTGFQFSEGQSMLLGLDLPTVHFDYESHLVSDEALSVTKVAKFLNVNVGETIWNLDGRAWKGEVAVLLAGADACHVLSSSATNEVPNLHDVVRNLQQSVGGMLKLPSNLADGDYRLFVGAKNSRDKQWSLIRRAAGLANSYIISVTNGAVSSITSDTDDRWQAITTGMDVLSDDASSKAPIQYYDLQGRMFNATPRGLLIRKQGGLVRKVIVR